MKKKIKFLYTALILTFLIGCVISQSQKIPELEGKEIKVVREIKGNTTTLHFMDTKTGKEVYTKDIETYGLEKPILNISTPSNQPASNTNYYISLAIGIIIVILVAIGAWKLTKDNMKGETK